MRKIFLKPCAGLKVPDPETGRPLPESGAEILMNPYWKRRLRDKSVAVQEKPLPAKKPGSPNTETPKSKTGKAEEK